MIKEKSIFIAISISIIGVLLTFTILYESPLMAVLFFVTLLLSLAFYLFQYGNLSTFEVKAFSAGAKFIKEKKAEIEKDVHSVNKMRDHVKSLLEDSIKTRDELDNLHDQILHLSKELKETYELAKPPSIVVDRIEYYTIDSGYMARIYLKVKENKALGMVTIKALIILADDDVKIIDLYADSAKDVQTKIRLRSSGDCTSIANDGKSAELTYQPIQIKDLVISVELNGPSKLQISGSHDLTPFELEIKGEA